MAILKADGLDIISNNAEQTHRFGFRLGTLLLPGDIVCLSGDLGAGKTAFAKGIGQGWGATAALTSPTYNLVHIHKREKDKRRLYHLDCYRLDGAADAASVGLDDILDEEETVIFEWPEQINEALPKERLWINLHVLEQNRRNFVFEGCGKRYLDLIVKFREKIYGV